MIFVAFFVPLAVYLLVLGHINRRPRPVLVSGTVDFIGLLFAGSGFLLCGGPVVLSSLNERWRLFWLLGEGGSLAGLGHAWQLGLILSVLYFVVVVAGCAAVFAKKRGLTSIYNVEPTAVEAALVETCDQLGLSPIRSGNLFVFGLSLDGPTRPAPEGIQGPHWMTQTDRPTVLRDREEDRPLPGEEFAGQNAILELELFDAGKHATLRWDPPDSALRPVVDAELDRRLGLVGAPYHDTGLWLTLGGFTLLALSVLIVFVLVLRGMMVR